MKDYKRRKEKCNSETMCSVFDVQILINDIMIHALYKLNQNRKSFRKGQLIVFANIDRNDFYINTEMELRAIHVNDKLSTFYNSENSTLINTNPCPVSRFHSPNLKLYPSELRENLFVKRPVSL